MELLIMVTLVPKNMHSVKLISPVYPVRSTASPALLIRSILFIVKYAKLTSIEPQTT
jgi:hypothetical protein